MIPVYLFIYLFFFYFECNVPGKQVFEIGYQQEAKHARTEPMAAITVAFNDSPF